MSIDPVPQISLSAIVGDQGLENELRVIEKGAHSFVSIACSPDDWERAQKFLCSLRSANISAVIFLEKGNEDLDIDEIKVLLKWLHSVDQLVLENFVELCGQWLPKEYQAAFENEAKMEIKWFREWLTAASDPRVYKYPSLPWRSYVRKVIDENFKFAMRFLDLTTTQVDEANLQVMDDHIRQFLVAKKKVLCVFPKNWGKNN